MKKYIIILTLIVIFLIAAFLIYLGLQDRKDRTNIAVQHKWLAIIDLNNDQVYDINTVRQGDDVLVVIHPYHPVIKNGGIKVETLDSNQDGLISMLDPAFPHLRVLSIIDGNALVMVPMQAAGIHAIRLPRMNPNRKASAVVTDSSQRLVKIMQ